MDEPVTQGYDLNLPSALRRHGGRSGSRKGYNTSPHTGIQTAAAVPDLRCAFCDATDKLHQRPGRGTQWVLPPLPQNSDT